MSSSSTKIKQKKITQILEIEYGQLSKVPDDHPLLIELRDLLTNGEEKEINEPKEKEEVSSTDQLVPWNHIDTKLIYKLRKEQGIPLYQMAGLLEVSPSAYNRIEQGLERMKESQFTKITRILHVKRDEFIIKHKKLRGGR